MATNFVREPPQMPVSWRERLGPCCDNCLWSTYKDQNWLFPWCRLAREYRWQWEPHPDGATERGRVAAMAATLRSLSLRFRRKRVWSNTKGISRS